MVGSFVMSEIPEWNPCFDKRKTHPFLPPSLSLLAYTLLAFLQVNHSAEGWFARNKCAVNNIYH